MSRPFDRRTMLRTLAVSPVAGAAVAAEPDAVFAAVADFRAKADAYNHGQDEETEEAWREAEDAAFGTAPTTVAGLFCLLEAWWFVSVQDYGLHTDDSEAVAKRFEAAELDLRQLKSLMEAGRALVAANGGRSPMAVPAHSTSTSRRPLLTAALAGTVAGGGTFAARTVLAASDPAEEAFLRWLDLVGARNAGRGVTENETEEEWEASFVPIDAAEKAIAASRDGPAKAAVLALNELCYMLDSPKEASIADMMNGGDMGVRLALRVALCLRHAVSEKVAGLIADLGVNPSHRASETALFRAYCGEAVS